MKQYNNVTIEPFAEDGVKQNVIQTRYESSPREVATMNTETLRSNFLIENLLKIDQVEFVYSHYDRVIIGGAMPVEQQITLPNPAELKANFFLERRELGIINVGGDGQVTTDGTSYDLQKIRLFIPRKRRRRSDFFQF